MLYPYLPEPMRNPETFEWMLRYGFDIFKVVMPACLRCAELKLFLGCPQQPMPAATEYRTQLEAMLQLPPPSTCSAFNQLLPVNSSSRI